MGRLPQGLTTPRPTFKILLKFSTINRVAMSTVNFSVPEDVKQAFNITFEGQNKSAVITELMREAIERSQRKEDSQAAYLRILARRKHAPAITDAQLRAARQEGRP